MWLVLLSSFVGKAENGPAVSFSLGPFPCGGRARLRVNPARRRQVFGGATSLAAAHARPSEQTVSRCFPARADANTKLNTVDTIDSPHCGRQTHRGASASHATTRVGWGLRSIDYGQSEEHSTTTQVSCEGLNQRRVKW